MPGGPLAALAGTYSKKYAIACAISDAPPPGADPRPAFNFPQPPYYCPADRSPFASVRTVVIAGDQIQVLLPQPASDCRGTASRVEPARTGGVQVTIDGVTCDGEPAPTVDVTFVLTGDELLADGERFYREGAVDPKGGSPPLPTNGGAPTTAGTAAVGTASTASTPQVTLSAAARALVGMLAGSYRRVGGMPVACRELEPGERSPWNVAPFTCHDPAKGNVFADVLSVTFVDERVEVAGPGGFDPCAGSIIAAEQLPSGGIRVTIDAVSCVTEAAPRVESVLSLVDNSLVADGEVFAAVVGTR